MTTFTKEQLIEQARKNIEVLRGAVERIPGASDAAVIHLALAEITLASLEAPAVMYAMAGEALDTDAVSTCRAVVDAWTDEWNQDKPGGTRYKTVPLYSTQPAPVLPDSGREQFEEWFKFHHGEDGSIVTLHRANGGANYCDEFVDLAWISWKDSRAAMQGKAVSQNVQPVMFIDGDISPADAEKLAAAIREFNSEPREPSQMISEPVSQRDELPSREHFISLCNQFWNWQEADEINAGEEEPRLEWNGSEFSHRVTQALWRMYQASPGNSPVIPDGWVACSERMPEKADEVLCAKEFDGPGDWRQKVGYYLAGKWTVYSASWTPTHWMALPAAPQQE